MLNIDLVKYTKVREGLTLEGIEGHIANAIILWNLGNEKVEWRGTQNDCQLVLNFLLRAYHQRRITKKLYGEIPSTPDGYSALQNGSGYHLEHAIPIACIMWALFNNVLGRTLPGAIAEVRRIIHSTMRVAYVSRNEHFVLNKEYACTMPKGCERYPWADNDVWARYKASGVPVPQIRGTIVDGLIQ